MPKGGWSYGAGRPAWHVKAEHCRRLDVRRLSRDGWLRDGTSCTWGWHANGECLGSISMQAETEVLVLSYVLNGTPVRQRVPILRTARHFGGGRAWFACPGCNRRVAVLYLRTGFNCRTCSRLAYASQSEDAIDRAWRKQRRTEAKLEDDWRRPKGIHLVANGRLMSVIRRCEEEREAALYAYVHRRSPGLLDSEPFDVVFTGRAASDGSLTKRDNS